MENHINADNQNTQQIGQNTSDQDINKNQVNIETKIRSKRNIVIVLVSVLFFCSVIAIFYFVRRNNDYQITQKGVQQTTLTLNQPNSPSTTTVANIKIFESVPLEKNDAIVYYEFAYDKQGSLWISDKTGADRKKLIWSNSAPTILAIDWSPDGNKIAFTADFLSERSSKSGLYVYDGIKNEVKLVSMSPDVITSGTASNGGWSSDGRYFAYLSGASTGNGPIYLYDTQVDIVITIPLPFSENLGGPISWLGSSRFFLRSWNPVQYCNSATTDCQIEKESSAKSGFSLIQVDPTSLKVNKLVTRKLTEGAIDRYLVDEINNVIYLSGRDENVYKFNIQASTTEKINLSNLNDKRVFLSETYIPSPKRDRFIAIKDEGLGYTSTRVVEFKTLQSKVISDYNNKEDTGKVTDWYDNETVVMSSSKIWLININTLEKRQLIDFANTSAFAKVRPILNK